MTNNFQITHPKSAAVIGLLFAVPFLVMNAIVGGQIEPFYSLLRPEAFQTGIFEYLLLFTLLLVLPIAGAFIAARPMFISGERKFYLFNFIVVAILLVGSITLSVVLGTEIYRCDVLHIPNCD